MTSTPLTDIVKAVMKAVAAMPKRSKLVAFIVALAGVVAIAVASLIPELNGPGQVIAYVVVVATWAIAIVVYRPTLELLAIPEDRRGKELQERAKRAKPPRMLQILVRRGVDVSDFSAEGQSDVVLEALRTDARMALAKLLLTAYLALLVFVLVYAHFAGGGGEGTGSLAGADIETLARGLAGARDETEAGSYMDELMRKDERDRRLAFEALVLNGLTSTSEGVCNRAQGAVRAVADGGDEARTRDMIYALGANYAGLQAPRIRAETTEALRTLWVADGSAKPLFREALDRSAPGSDLVDGLRQFLEVLSEEGDARARELLDR